MSFIPSLLRVLAGAIVLLSASLFLNISGDTGSFEALLAMAPEKCIKVDGKRVCFEQGAKQKKKDDDDDDNGDDDDDKPKKKKKQQDVDTGLSECTIQQPGSGGGCKTGFKYVCEKMKSGKKCCGCVVDKNAKSAPPSGGGAQNCKEKCLADCSAKQGADQVFQCRYACNLAAC
jgi:hypothetical protein